jgi:hypothetical protein
VSSGAKNCSGFDHIPAAPRCSVAAARQTFANSSTYIDLRSVGRRRPRTHQNRPARARRWLPMEVPTPPRPAGMRLGGPKVKLRTINCDGRSPKHRRHLL